MAYEVNLSLLVTLKGDDHNNKPSFNWLVQEDITWS